MPMHNLLQYCDHCFVTSESLWNYHRDEVNDDANENNTANNNKTSEDRSV